MISGMESGTTNNTEEVRSSSTGPPSVSSVTTVNCNSGRCSPKIAVSTIPSPSASLLQRNSSSPSMLKKITSKNHNNTGINEFNLSYIIGYRIRNYSELNRKFERDPRARVFNVNIRNAPVFPDNLETQMLCKII